MTAKRQLRLEVEVWADGLTGWAGYELQTPSGRWTMKSAGFGVDSWARSEIAWWLADAGGAITGDGDTPPSASTVLGS